MSLDELKVDVVVLACAVSAGIHGALVPDHLAEGTGPGLSFAIATVLLAWLAVALTRHPSQPVLVAAALVSAGLIAAYVAVLANGLPLVHPEQEAVDGLALFTKAVEAIGLFLALSLVRRPALSILTPKGNPK
jgi:hypothetical protein